MQVRAFAKKILKPFYSILQNGYYILLDATENRDELISPRRLIFVGDGDFKSKGNEFLKYFIEIGGIKKTDHVLDVGCGIGRMAVPLTE